MLCPHVGGSDDDGLFVTTINNGVEKRPEMPRVTQREVMLRIYHECAGDFDRTVEAYASAERRGQGERKRNRGYYTPEDYARALLRDGFAKGWLPDFGTSRSSPRHPPVRFLVT
jgi:hypothetical protein